ncbi:hypothetical protein FOC1_g10011033 [Fusarium oxysporum f. sp. cubense race 1]|uniref:Uncharacterized protein n=1 Tax=Fusarium oxysporum f. sp. cubense (strain race 1) TaxID=1229664 RepID=N4UY69_FUSC1|nr:hypothetical protein FOC1_g10011033 [Fusarium oxysporum f. sp. cubense race 1]
MQPPGVISPCQTEQEQRNIDLCKEYMRIAYSPTENKGATSVQHLCHPDSWFWAPATFPGCETPMDYADSHSTVMASVADLKIIRFDQSWAKDGHVLLRYTAQGSHCGEPYKGIAYSRPRPVSGGQTRTVQRRESNQAGRNVTEPHV